MEHGDSSRNEIVKKFDLPERKTKLKTILKLQDEKVVYCLCQSSDISRFMICCEKCDEWYHGDCIGLSKKDAKFINKWYCFDCISSYGLQVVYLPNVKNPSTKKKKVMKRKLSFKQESSKSCGQCSNCLQNEECGNKDFMFIEKRAKHNYQELTLPTHTATSNKIMDDQPSKTNKEKKSKKGRKFVKDWKRKQCIGPECVESARVDSKYCSKACGLALGKLRLLSILPLRIMEREQVPCVADKLDQAKLDHIRLQKKITAEKLEKLDRKEKILKEVIARAKQVPVVESKEEMDEESKMFCLTCGWEIPSRTAIKHMEICFKKFEGQTAFVGPYKTNSDRCDILCEFYDAAKKTYCKRLRYICPDHFKPPKVEDDEVCGCPIIQTISRSIFSGVEQFCQQPKKRCDHHYNWEILTLSEIDLERLREWNRMGQLTEEEAIILRQLTERSGALGLLLHSVRPSDYYL